MPTIEEVINDPDFHSLAQSERKKVLSAIDTDFAALTEIEQNKATIQLAQKFGKQLQTLPAHRPAEPEITAGEVASGAAANFIPSAVNVAKDIYRAVRHPIDTTEAVGKTISGAVQKAVPDVIMDQVMRIPSANDQRPIAEAIGTFFSDRYGGEENLKKTMRDDPAGFILDLSTVLSGGGAAAAKAPGIAGKIGEAAKVAGAVTDPVTLAGNGLSAAGKGAASVIPDIVKQRFTPESLYASAMKFSNNPNVLSPADRRAAVTTGLKEKMLPNEASYQKLWDQVTANKAKVNEIVAKGEKAGDTVSTSEVTRLLSPLEKRAALVEKFNPEFAQVLRETRSNIEAYGDNIPVASAQALKETLQDLSKYGTDDRSRFAVAANKALGRGIRIQLETVYPELQGLNRNSAALLTLENELAKAVGRVGNRDIVSLGMRVGIGGAGDASKAAGIVSSIFDLPNIKARLALLLYEAKTGKKLPPSRWETAAKVVFGKPSRLVSAQAGNVEEQLKQENQP